MGIIENKVHDYTSPEMEIVVIEVEQAVMQYSIQDLDGINPDLEW